MRIENLAHFKDSSIELFVGDSIEISYSDFFKEVERWKAQLRLRGIQPGAKVVIIGSFSALGTSLVVALLDLQCILIPQTRDSSIVLDKVIDISGSDWLIEINSGLDIEQQSIVSTIHSTDHPLIEQLKSSKHSGLILFSSGTTGEPKAILHDLDRVVMRFKPRSKRFRALPMLMFDHFGGFNTIFGMLTSESTVVDLASTGLESICAAIERYGVTLLPTTPSFLSLLLASGMHNRYDLSSIQRITYGTEPMNETLLRRLSNTFPNVKFQQTYGLSEVGVLSSRSHSNQSTMVQLGGDGFELKIVDGILWVRSSFAMLGYLNRDDRETLSDGWFNTQDRVEEVNGFLRIIGRESDFINVGGQKVNPHEVEMALLELEEVAEIRVYGESHPLLGQIIVAEIVPAISIEPQALKHLIRRYAFSRLQKFKVPQKFRIVKNLGITTRGKRQR